MTIPKHFKFQDVLDFIHNQPDDRQVEMSDPDNRKDNCGCIMVQFGRDQGLEFSSCNYTGNILTNLQDEIVAIVDDFPFEYSNIIRFFHRNGVHDSNTFGSLKPNAYLK